MDRFTPTDLFPASTSSCFYITVWKHGKCFLFLKYSYIYIYIYIYISIWDLKDNNVKHSIKWSILKRSTPYKGGSIRCNLCLAEKLSILTAEKSSLLNKRSELITKCRHVNKFLAANHKQQRPR